MMNASECETRFLASSRIRAGSGFIFFFFLPSSSRSPTPAFFFGHMPTTHVLSCHGGSFTLLPSLKCNYCWWRSNASCVTDNQTGAKSIWLNWLRINCGTSISRRSGFNCAISSLSVKATHFSWSEDSRCHMHPGCPLFTLSVGLHAKCGGNDTSPNIWTTSAPLNGICSTFCLKQAGKRTWPRRPRRYTSCVGYQTAKLELDSTRCSLPKEPDFVLTIC